ncbi:MAG TPA: L-threonylcarbamoyladenylate synthase [Candidatus Saccharimonadales bacterium]|nr:L-threonylcarbamoyladenylate synthase [Candidatus Saccharimonadales bacterium]
MRLQNETQAIAILRSGGIGVLPTDTLYGIVACAADSRAVARLYRLKSRERKPGTIIAANVEQFIELGVDEKYLRRVEQWWPNSLSIETPLGPELSYLHQGTDRQGLRVVPDARVRALLEQTGPLLTSSANLPGEQPANTVQEAYTYFGDLVDFYVDGGDRSGFSPSTLARITDKGFEIIRQGIFVVPDRGI